MKQVIAIVLCVWAVFATKTHGKSFVWEVSKNGNKIYVGGTVHVLNAQSYPLPEEYDLAFQQSDIIVFETDIDKTNSLEFQQLLMRNALYSDGRSLKTVLSKEVYQELEKASAKLGLPLAQLNSMKASVIGMMLTVTAISKQGITSEGIDKYYYQKAVKAAKSIGRFETINQQLALITQMADGQEDAFIRSTLRDLNKPQMIREMIQYVLTGDHVKLHEFYLTPMKEVPSVYKSLIVDRNNLWLPNIEKMFPTPEVEFLLVGALHLWGEHGILTQLENKGYTVTQLEK